MPVVVHMDHAQSPEIIRRAAEIGGFDEIMVDMSHYDENENKAKTKELTAFLPENGTVAEAEPGRIHGGEKGFVVDTGKLEGVLTTPEQAEEFMALGIDWLAPAFGNHHGNYGPQGPQLDYQRLGRIHEVAKGRVQLVLHGTNDFDEAIFQKCIKGGVAKCHINNVMNDRWTEVQRNKAGRSPITSVIEEGTQAMQKAVEKYVDWVGSTGRA
ncbi:class II fructose-bisphosphate aldolase [Candidatus Bathyarchaeota archaeon]|nr:class II fructose-bisphosphate aldolase [Candidatus Bathyarchaeota archaeon]